MSLEKLESNVKRMLEGEKKRREKAIDYIYKIGSLLAEEDIWGSSSGDPYTDSGTITVKKINEKGEKIGTDLYFRYVIHEGENADELPGFYDSRGDYMHFWGKPLEDIKGATFWAWIQIIMEWIEKIILPSLKKREEGREETVKKIEKMIA